MRYRLRTLFMLTLTAGALFLISLKTILAPVPEESLLGTQDESTYKSRFGKSRAIKTNPREEERGEASSRSDRLESTRRFEQLAAKFENWAEDSAAPGSVSKFIGITVTLTGGALPPGGTNDLISTNGTIIHVLTDEPVDLRPHAVRWEVSLYGKITSIDWPTKTISISIRPEDWQVIQTW